MGREELEKKLRSLKRKSKKNMWHQHMFAAPKKPVTSSENKKKNTIVFPLSSSLEQHILPHPTAEQSQVVSSSPKRKGFQNLEEETAAKRARVQALDRVDVPTDVPLQQPLPQNNRVEALKTRFAYIIAKAQGKSIAEVPQQLLPAVPKANHTATPGEKRKEWIKAQREAARRAISRVKNTAHFNDNLEATREILRLIGSPY